MDIENGKLIGVASTFSVMEYMAVMKQFISKQLNRSITQTETKLMKDAFIEFISRMGIILFDSDTLILDASGSCSFFTSCEYLIEKNQPMKGIRDSKWHTLNGADAIHALFAIKTNSTHLATFDDDFKGIDKEIAILDIEEKY